MAEELNIDMAAIEAEVAGMSKEELYKQLVDIKARARIAQKKYYNPESAKKARLKRAEVVKLMTAKARELGLYDQIVEEAANKADEALDDASAVA